MAGQPLDQRWNRGHDRGAIDGRGEGRAASVARRRLPAASDVCQPASAA